MACAETRAAKQPHFSHRPWADHRNRIYLRRRGTNLTEKHIYQSGPGRTLVFRRVDGECRTRASVLTVSKVAKGRSRRLSGFARRIASATGMVAKARRRADTDLLSLINPGGGMSAGGCSGVTGFRLR
jgi:hypothetical protein